MSFKVSEIADKKSPSCFSTKFIIGKYDFLQRRIKCKDDIFLYGLSGSIIDIVVRKVKVEDGRTGFEETYHQLRAS